MNTSGHRATPYPANVVVGMLVVAIFEFSLVPKSECK
jgi:hypothetical protein